MSWVIAQTAAGSVTGVEDVYLLWGFILLGVAVVLLFLELFVPSGGLIGLLAGVSAIGSVVAFFKYDTTWGVVAVSSYIILGPIIGVFVFRLWLHSPLARGMILGGSDPNAITSDEETVQSSELARRERLARLKQLIGAEGLTVTPLHPVGTVKIGDQRLDALAESGTIEANTPIVVTDVYDNQIKVRPR